MAPLGPEGLPDRLRSADRCLVMGVVNVTPDSFSDGGRWLAPVAAIEHGLDLVAQGADIVDVGGESTRPGAERVPEAEEARRVLPVIEGLVGAGIAVSVDTMRASIAELAVEAGAVLVNDVSGGLADPDMYATVARTGAAYVVMHWRSHAADMNSWAQYGPDVVGDVIGELQDRVTGARAAGLSDSRIVVDPGLGFAKNADHNWALLAGLDRLRALGFPVLLGASRKRFLGELLADADGLRPIPEREDATTAISALAAGGGVWCVRVHGVRATCDAVLVAQSWAAAAAVAQQAGWTASG